MTGSLSDADHPLTLESFQKMLDEDIVRLANLPAGRYYVDRTARIISMNFAFPRYVEAVSKLNGQRSVILYTPSLMEYDLAELVLSTFVTPIDDKKYVCYRQPKIQKCELDNLYWGTESESYESFSNATKAYLNYQIKCANAAKDNPSEQKPIDSQIDEGHTFPLGNVSACVALTFPISRILITFNQALKQYLHTHDIAEEHHYQIRITITSLEHLLERSLIPDQAVLGMLGNPPDIYNVQLIYHHALVRLKRILDGD